MLMFFAGLLVGGAIGVFAVCLCVAAGDADRAEERARDREAGPRGRPRGF